MINKKYHVVETFTKSILRIAKTEVKSLALMHIYMTAHFSGLEQALQSKVAGLN